MQKLLISLPESTDYKVYEASDEGAFNFRFCSFEGGQVLDLKMAETVDESFAAELEGGHHFNIPTKEEYAHLIQDTIDYIKRNNLGKIVMSRPQRFEVTIEPFTVFKKLVKAYPKACVYLLTHPEIGTWMAATPETLVKKEGDSLKTMSLAGTQKKGEEDKFSDKESVEQQLVTDFILETLDSVNGISEVKTDGPHLAEAGNLVHLRTLIEATVDSSFDLNNLLARLHPTPAVAGLPRKEALDFIKKMEQYKRGFYSGYFGLSDGKDAHYFVNLRCMEVFEDSFVLFAGGGITKDSDPEAEWRETENKMGTLLGVIGSD